MLADFDNSTGDPVFDSTLRRGMAVQLEQSPYLSLIADDRIQQVLQEMGQPADARLTPAIAREICERTASAAVLDGSIAPSAASTSWACAQRTARVARSWPRNRCRRPEKKMCCMPWIRWRANSERRSANPSRPSRSTTLRWHEATTPSLEALKAFSLGLHKPDACGAHADALPFFSRAVELDPNFAVAYDAMSMAVYLPPRAGACRHENIRKAYELREKVSEQERLTIETELLPVRDRRTGKGSSFRRAVAADLPEGPRISLGIFYRRLGNPEKAVEEDREALRLMPNLAANYQNLAADLVSLNRLDEAEAVYKLSDERNLPYVGRAKSLYLLAFLKGDQTRMAQLAILCRRESAAQRTRCWARRLTPKRGMGD